MQVKDKAREDDGSVSEVVLTIVADADEVDAAADAFFDQIAQRDIPGFRKGKAPRQVLEQNVGGHANAMGGVAEQLINDGAFAAIDDSDTVFIEDPQFNVDTQLELGVPFSFTVSGKVAPDMNLADDGPVTVAMPPEEATDEEVESAIDELRDHYHTFEEIEDVAHEAQMGDYVLADITVTNHGKVISGLNNSGRLVGLGMGTMPASFDEQVVGAKVGDELEFDFEAKKEDGTSDYGDGDLHAKVIVRKLRRRVLPDLDDEFAAKLGCTDADDIAVQVRRNINMQKAKELPRLKVDRAVDAVIERLVGDVPEYYVSFIRQDVGREFMQNLQEQGTNLQQWMLQNSVDGDKMKGEVDQEARRRAAIDCALEAVFRAQNLEVTDEAIDELFAGEDDGPAKRKSWEDAHRMSDLRKMARQRLATQWLVDNAIVQAEE